MQLLQGLPSGTLVFCIHICQKLLSRQVFTLCQIQMRDPVHSITKKQTIMICLREGVCAPYHDFGCGVLILGIPGLKEFFVLFEMEECTWLAYVLET